MTFDLLATIKRVQLASGIDADGVAGEHTWSAIAKKFGVATGPWAAALSGAVVSALANELAGIAEKQMGTQEDAKHQNRGSAILKYQEATSLEGQGWPWCAAFVCWCVEQLVQANQEKFGEFKRPMTASAFGLIDWARSAGAAVFRPGGGQRPQRGDIVVYTFSHCGIVQNVDAHDDNFHAIEGNSNIDGSRDGYEVVSHARSFAKVNRFIRIPQLQEAA